MDAAAPVIEHVFDNMERVRRCPPSAATSVDASLGVLPEARAAVGSAVGFERTPQRTRRDSATPSQPGNSEEWFRWRLVRGPVSRRFGVGPIPVIADQGLFVDNVAALTDKGFDHVLATRLHRDPTCAAAL